jgi:protein ImuA
LQLAAEAAATPILLFRAHNDKNQSAAVTRWRVNPRAGSRDRFGFFESPRWHVDLERARGGRNGAWDMEWDRDALSLRLSAGLGNRAARADVAA